MLNSKTSTVQIEKFCKFDEIAMRFTCIQTPILWNMLTLTFVYTFIYVHRSKMFSQSVYVCKTQHCENYKWRRKRKRKTHFLLSRFDSMVTRYWQTTLHLKTSIRFRSRLIRNHIHIPYLQIYMAFIEFHILWLHCDSNKFHLPPKACHFAWNLFLSLSFSSARSLNENQFNFWHCRFTSFHILMRICSTFPFSIVVKDISDIHLMQNLP